MATKPPTSLLDGWKPSKNTSKDSCDPSFWWPSARASPDDPTGCWMGQGWTPKDPQGVTIVLSQWEKALKKRGASWKPKSFVNETDQLFLQSVPFPGFPARCQRFFYDPHSLFVSWGPMKSEKGSGTLFLGEAKHRLFWSWGSISSIRPRISFEPRHKTKRLERLGKWPCKKKSNTLGT